MLINPEQLESAQVYERNTPTELEDDSCRCQRCWRPVSGDQEYCEACVLEVE